MFYSIKLRNKKREKYFKAWEKSIERKNKSIKREKKKSIKLEKNLLTSRKIYKAWEKIYKAWEKSNSVGTYLNNALGPTQISILAVPNDQWVEKRGKNYKAWEKI